LREPTWLGQYPEAKALLQRPEDELLDTAQYAGYPEDREPETGVLWDTRGREEEVDCMYQVITYFRAGKPERPEMTTTDALDEVLALVYAAGEGDKGALVLEFRDSDDDEKERVRTLWASPV
jgi:hypothetical protein